MLFPTILSLLPTLAATPTPLPEGPPPAIPVQEEEVVDDQGWSGNFTLGASFSSGNNDSRSASSTFDAIWKGDPNRVTLGALWNYQEQEVVLQRRLYGTAKYDRFFSEKAYGFAQTSGDYDLEAGVDLRFTGGVGGGYQFHDDETWKFSGELGVSYVSEDFRSGAHNEYPAARVAYSATYAAGDTWELFNAAQIFPSLESGDDVYAIMDTRFRLTLTEAMFLQLGWLFSWDNTPDVGKKRQDHIVTLTLGWGF